MTQATTDKHGAQVCIAVAVRTCAPPAESQGWIAAIGEPRRRRYIEAACGRRLDRLTAVTVPGRIGATCPDCLATSAGDLSADTDPPDTAVTWPEADRRPARYTANPYLNDPNRGAL